MSVLCEYTNLLSCRQRCSITVCNTQLFWQHASQNPTFGGWVLQGASAEEKSAKSAGKRQERMQQVLRALGVLASSSGVSAERQQFMEMVTFRLAVKFWLP